MVRSKQCLTSSVPSNIWQNASFGFSLISYQSGGQTPRLHGPFTPPPFHDEWLAPWAQHKGPPSTKRALLSINPQCSPYVPNRCCRPRSLNIVRSEQFIWRPSKCVIHCGCTYCQVFWITFQTERI